MASVYISRRIDVMPIREPPSRTWGSLAGLAAAEMLKDEPLIRVMALAWIVAAMLMSGRKMALSPRCSTHFAIRDIGFELGSRIFRPL